MEDTQRKEAEHDHRLRHVVIIGGGTAGWMTASALARYLGRSGCEIKLVESEEIGTVGVGEATIPPITKFHRSLGLDERELIAATGATFKLGIQFVDWYRKGHHYLHPFGSFGEDVDGISFQQIFLKLAGERRCGEMWRYSPCAVAALEGWFGQPRHAVPSPAGGFPHAFHLDARLYAAHLRKYAEARGVRRIEGRIVDAGFDPENGHVRGVTLADGRVVEGELFLDCSGARGLLIGQQLGIDYLDWRDHLPCDRAVVAPTQNVGAPVPFTRSHAREAGWQWSIPLQHRAGNGYVYSSTHSSDEAAEAVFRSGLRSAPLADPHRISFTTGRRRQFWRGNVVAIGLSAGFLEPLESTSIHLIQTGITKLLGLWPDRNFPGVLSREYDRQMAAAFESVRDFIVLHYKATTRDDSSFWNHVREMAIPDTLADRIELFRRTGAIPHAESDIFSIRSWFTVMLGQGIIPETYSALADTIDSGKLQVRAEQVRRKIADAVAAMPTHAEFLAELGTAVQAA